MTHVIPNAIHNMDIERLYDMHNRVVFEIQKSASESGTSFHEADIGRIKAYSKWIQDFKEWVVKRPRQDHPETHPELIDLEAPINFQKGENDAFNQLQRMVIAARDELVMSASANQTTWLDDPDSIRFDQHWEKIDSLVSDHIDEITTVDTPESSPREIGQGKGRTHVKN
jgi:hypothetical protein